VPARLIRFDEFSLDCDRYELLRAGRPVKLEKNPMELLILLATKNGHLVTRQEIIERLWGKDVFVDTEHGINTAIRKIRFALRDDPENPRFVQTVTGRGYRFLGEPRNGARDAETSPNPQQYAAESVGLKPAQDRGAGGWIWVGTGLVVATLVVGIVFALNLGGVRDRVLANSRVGPIHSIAVLPLANLSGDPAQDYFADGMTDEVITMLAKNTSLGVVSRTSTMQYKSAKRPLREIGRELGADAILEGSVERSGDRVHMTMQLIHAPSDTHIWAESYDRNFNEAFSLPLELSQTVAKTLKVSVAPAASPRYINPEAHDEYLRGHYLWYSMDNENSRKHFERAIQLQPEYAAAWSGVADDYIASVVEGLAPPELSMQRGAEAARKALELDDTAAEAHNSLAAFYLFGKWDWRSAEKESRRALELNPNLAEAHHLYSWVLVVAQRPDEAVREEKRAMELDPFSEPWALGLVYLQTRQIDAAISELQVRTKAQPNIVGFFNLSGAYWLKGMWKESQQSLEEGLRLTGGPKAAAAAHHAFEIGGERAVEEWIVKDIKARARKSYVPPFDLASRYACLGDKEKTLKYLGQAFQEHSAWLVFIQNEPVLDFLHSDERYRALVREMDLPPVWERTLPVAARVGR
jgi:TolB-like protein/DNA-binding winged helix-turn-helix (wHTH) protein